MNKEINYGNYLASLIECEEKQDKSIKHEWLVDSLPEAVRIANYLRSHGYAAKTSTTKLTGLVSLFYVGVPFSSFKKIKQ